jgi:DNA replication protein DnaC
MNEIKKHSEVMLPFMQDLKLEVPKPEMKTAICNLHGQYQATVLEDGTLEPCPICTAEKSNEWKRKKQEAENENWRREKQRFIDNENLQLYKQLNISPEFYYVTLDDYKPKTKAQEEAKKAVAEMIKTRKGKIILLGNNGAGKTMLANIVAKELKGCVYTMYEITTMIRQSYTARAEMSELQIVRKLIELPFLAIDELGRVSNTEAVQTWFSFILDKRHSLGLPTMIIGNLHFMKDCEHKGCPRCFENFFDKDVLSRFHEDTVVIVIKSSDGRVEKKTMKYFSD